MTDPEIHIAETVRKVGDRTLYDFECEEGYLETSYIPMGWFCIANIRVGVEHRRRGVGKELLRHAAEKADELDVSLIYSAITSRECLDTMVGVFGAEAVMVDNTGSYAEEYRGPKDKTHAALWLPSK